MAGVPSRYYYNPQPEDRELTYRSAMLPLGTYRNDDGTESAGLAWPGMITEPINALERLGSGGFSNPQDPAAKQDMTTLLLSLYGGNALNPLARVPKGAISSGAMREARLGMEADSAIDLWHYSPRDFDAFDLKKSDSGLSYAQGIHFLDRNNPSMADEFGRYLYQAKLRAAPDQIIDWQKPLAEQPQAVRDVGMRPVAVPDEHSDLISEMHASWKDMRDRTKMDDAAISEELARRGIKAVKHGGHYVVLDDAAVPIVHKWRGGQQLYSDTGRPSLMGAALASNEANLRKMAREDVAPAPSALSPSEAFYQKLPDDLLEFPAMSSIRDQQRMLDYVDGLSKLADDNWTGTLHSDTGRPSLMGSALSSEQPNALERYYRNGFQTY